MKKTLYSQALMKQCARPVFRNAFKAISFLTFLIIILSGSRQSASGQCLQAPCDAAQTISCFKVDAELRITSPYNDWFDNQFDSTSFGNGIISNSPLSSPYRISPASFRINLMNSTHKNITYEQRMSVPFATDVNICGQDIKMLDAVAARDNHCAGSQKDSSVFTSGADKNPDNPSTWSVGISGVPQKNDIIDVGGHIRRAPANGLNAQLLGYAFATTRNTSGDSHIDFEIFRTNPKVINGQFVNTGNDGGHTASKLITNLNSTFKPGDLIVSIDYGNGGTNPCASIWVWIDPNNVDGAGSTLADYNNYPGRLYEFTLAFKSGTNSGPYGYAQIQPRAGTPTNQCLFVSVINTTSVPAAPWENLSAQSAAMIPSLQTLQLVEIHVNFSAYGLDLEPMMGPCYNLFGSLLVKTRSSTSFTSEMKDYAGPYLFGNFAEANADAGPDKNLSCSYPTAQLFGSSTVQDAIFNWTVVPGSGGAIIGNPANDTITVDKPGVYVLEVINPLAPTCNAFDTVVIVSVQDTIDPEITCPSDVTVSCIDQITPGATTYKEYLNLGGTIIDASGDIAVSFTDSYSSTGSCSNTLSREYTVTDTCGNFSSCTQVFTIIDDVNPVIHTGPADLTLGCNPIIPAPNTALINATDNCGNVTKSVLQDVVVGTCNRILTRTYRATDVCGNFTDYIQKIYYKVDTQAPVITANNGACGSSVNIGCNPTGPQIENGLGGATATDNCDGSITPSFTDALTANGCTKTKTRTWTAVDSCGNQATACTLSVTWVEDTQAPVITLSTAPALQFCNPTPAQIESSLGNATYTDNCTGTVTFGFTDASSGAPCARSKTRTWTALDACGNQAVVATRTVNWREDTQAPTISCAQGGNLGCNPSGPQIENALGTATANDNCDGGTLNPTFVDNQSNVGCDYTKTRTWNVSDQCGNAATPCVVTVTWRVDLTAPVLTPTRAAAVVNLGCNPSVNDIANSFGRVNIAETCSAVTLDSSDVTGGTPCARFKTRTWTATDGCGNVALSVNRRTEWREDTTIPVITCNNCNVPNNTNLGCNPRPTQIDSALGAATATDNCGLVTLNVSTPPASGTCAKSQTRTWTATDSCGNSATFTRTMTWTEDVTAPVLVCPADTEIVAPGGSTGPCIDLGGGGVATYVGSNKKRPHSHIGIDFRQPRNENHPSVPLNWTNGVNNKTQAEYHEGMGVPQRLILTGLNGNSHTLTFRHEAVKRQAGDVHAYDFLMSWNQAVTLAGMIGNGSRNELQNLLAEECGSGISSSALTACNSAIHSATAILPDNMGNPPNHHGINGVNSVIQAFESHPLLGNRTIEIEATAPITAFNIAFDGYSGSSTGDNYAWYTITWTSSAPSVVIKMAGRLASGENNPMGYGACYGAASIDGAPYHFKLQELDQFSLGNRDNQVMAEKACNVEIPVTFGNPSATDGCGGNPTIAIVDSATISYDSTGAKTHCRTWSATDACGNTTQCTQCIRVTCTPTPIVPQDTITPTVVTRIGDEISTGVEVYPNPAQETANIDFVLSGYDSDALLEIYTISGIRVAVLYNAFAKGDVQHRVQLDARSLAPGLYTYRLTTSEGIMTDKITIVK